MVKFNECQQSIAQIVIVHWWNSNPLLCSAGASTWWLDYSWAKVAWLNYWPWWNSIGSKSCVHWEALHWFELLSIDSWWSWWWLVLNDEVCRLLLAQSSLQHSVVVKGQLQMFWSEFDFWSYICEGALLVTLCAPMNQQLAPLSAVEFSFLTIRLSNLSLSFCFRKKCNCNSKWFCTQLIQILHKSKHMSAVNMDHCTKFKRFWKGHHLLWQNLGGMWLI